MEVLHFLDLGKKSAFERLLVLRLSHNLVSFLSNTLLSTTEYFLSELTNPELDNILLEESSRASHVLV